MEHDAKYAHNGRTSIVHLNKTFVDIGLLIEGVPYKDNGNMMGVTNKIARLIAIDRVLHHKNLKEPNEGDNLEEALLGGCIRAIYGF